MIEESIQRETFLKKCSAEGWEIIFEDEDAFQLKRKKRYSRAFAISGLILLLVGIGVLVWIFGYLEYLCRNDEIFYITKSDAYDNQPSDSNST